MPLSWNRLNPQNVGDGRSNEGRIRNRFEEDEKDAVGKVVEKTVRDGDGQPRLSRPACPSQGHETHAVVPYDVNHFLEFSVSPEQ